MDIVYVTERKANKVSLDPTQTESRYRTRQLEIHFLGKNKMIKTVLTNLDNVAKDMQIPSEYLIKFIGYCLSAKTHKNTISGKYSASVLSNIVKDFILTVVCCDICGKPEITLKSLKKNCRSCGSKTMISSPDKFVKYIENRSHVQKQQRKNIHKSPQLHTKTHENYSGSTDDDNSVEWSVDVSNEAVTSRRMNHIGGNLGTFQ